MVLLAYADLVLISTNYIAGIIFNTFLSIRFLGEKFLWKYDLPAFALMAIGAMTIVLLADTDEKLFTPDQMKALLTNIRSVIYLLTALVLVIFTIIYVRMFLKAIVKFEEDLHSWAK